MGTKAAVAWQQHQLYNNMRADKVRCQMTSETIKKSYTRDVTSPDLFTGITCIWY